MLHRIRTDLDRDLDLYLEIWPTIGTKQSIEGRRPYRVCQNSRATFLRWS
jgi:hypothetical protein